jgi:hypothetical protein
MMEIRSELPPGSPEPAAAAPRTFSRAAAFRSMGFSLIANALCPWLLFRFLEPRFHGGSVLPLLYLTTFPIIGFLFGIWRKRMVDAIALIALCGITIHITVTVLSPDVSTALVLRPLEGAIIGLCFLLSAFIGRPVVLYIARQFVAAGAPARRARFEAIVGMDKARVFYVATIVWGCGLVIMSAVHVALAIDLPHPEYVLLYPILGTVTNLVLVGWTTRYTARRVSSYLRAAT